MVFKGVRSNMKGIILAGGTGSRLHPITISVSKHLLPIYDKPMIYYPLSVLMLAGIKEILIITTPNDRDSYKNLLGDGSRFGISLEYIIQDNPEGLAQAFIIGEKFIGHDSVCLILGDNIFYGQGLTTLLKNAVGRKEGATLFGYKMKDPENFGVIEHDKTLKIISIEEKPLKPKSNMIGTGLYFYDNSVIERAKGVKKSQRGEYEITCINQSYLDDNKLHLEILGRGFAWLDTGTHESLLQASQFVETVEKRQGYKIACLEEISLNQGWITTSDMMKSLNTNKKSAYNSYLIELIETKKI